MGRGREKIPSCWLLLARWLLVAKSLVAAVLVAQKALLRKLRPQNPH